MGSVCLLDECPQHLAPAEAKGAAKWTKAAIAAGDITAAMLPDSLRVLVEALDWNESAADTLNTLTASQAVAFVQAIAMWQAMHDLEPDGKPGPRTRSVMAQRDAAAEFEKVTRASGYDHGRYPPGAESTKDLARAACTVLGLPQQLAEHSGLHNIMRRESAGYVGRPNYTIHLDGEKVYRVESAAVWPKVWEILRAGNFGVMWPEGGSRSTACGLGQLLASNMSRLGPTGVAGYGVALAEMCALIQYVLARYRAPGSDALQAFTDAWEFYNLEHFDGPKSERPKWCRYSWRALRQYGGGHVKPGEGY